MGRIRLFQIKDYCIALTESKFILLAIGQTNKF